MDLETRTDIEQFLLAFYKEAFQDDKIGNFFTEVVPLDLDTHIPQIADFWESVVFGKKSYRKNVMEVHQHIHLLSSIHKDHLDRWVQIFTTIMDAHFSGPNATLMKQRATSIATIMDIKLNYGGLNH